MSEEKENKRNNKIIKACQDIGHCCPYAFLQMNSGPRDTDKRIARKVNLSDQTIKWNRRQIRLGKLSCMNLANCQIPNAEGEGK